MPRKATLPPTAVNVLDRSLHGRVTLHGRFWVITEANIERLYKQFNMHGERYHTFKKGDVQFFALDSNYMDTKQLTWLEQNLRS